MKKNIGQPSLWLLIALIALPQISETIFSPALPAIAAHFTTTMASAQLTISIYFLAFALGVFFFGRLSDKIGRRTAMLYGLALYVLGSIGCLFAPNLLALLTARFIQAFGISVGSVITQTILRESLHGTARHQAFAMISAALAFTPAIGPLIGGFTVQYAGLHMVFIVLIVVGASLFGYTFIKLPETAEPSFTPLQPIVMRMLRNPNVWCYGFMIGAINGILFSYYAEAPFIYTELFALSSARYGFLGMVVALASLTGALCAKRLVKHMMPNRLILLGSSITLLGACSALLTSEIIGFTASMFIVLFGTALALPSCLSLALVDFPDVVGSASAILSLGYYALVSALTFSMSILHDGTLYALPFYIIGTSVAMLLISLKLQK